jgi:hypothetical protein
MMGKDGGHVASLGKFVIIAAAVSLSPALAAGQAKPPAVAKAAATVASEKALRTSWGDPDLQGIWTNSTSVPFQRPADPAAAARRRDAQPGSTYDPNVASVGAYNGFWTERGARERGVAEGQRPAQTALIVDPADGKLPSLTPEAQKYAETVEALRRPERPSTWAELNPYDRCITRGMPGAMIPGFYNHNYQIMQAPGYVAILIEMIHDVRIIPLDGRPHLGSALRQWMGNSRGRWEGQTLVVETTDFTNKIREFMGNAQRLPNGDSVGRYEASFGTSTLTLVERFTRVDENMIDYRFTVADAATFTSPWTVSAPMARIDGPIHEYACHEGNYAVPNMLRTARVLDEGEDLKK